MHALRIQRHRVEERLARLGDVALGVALGQEPLVAPPQVQAPPVDRVPRGRGGERGQQAVAVAPAGQHDGGVAGGGLGVDDLGDQPRGGGLGHQFLVAVDDELRCAHLAAASFSAEPSADASADFPAGAPPAAFSAAAHAASAAPAFPACSRSTPNRSADA